MKTAWEKQIEELTIIHKSITLIGNLGLYSNLRKLNLMDNNIAKI